MPGARLIARPCYTPEVASPSVRRLASPLHTAGVLLAVAAWSTWGKFHADQMRASMDAPRLPLYAATAAFEWLLLAFVVWGATAHTVLGPRWQSAKQLLRDIGVAAPYWLVSGFLLVLLARLLHATELGRNTRFLLPRNGLEIVCWIALSITAGICEEAVFRGYLQPQLGALTGSAPAGILLSAALFGAGHAYQGPRPAVLIALYGLMFGLLAHWRKTVRPGMMAHAWQDTMSGLILRRLQ